MTDGRAAAPRLLSLDAIRGVAVMGIVLMNVAAFAMPFAAYSDPRAWGRLDGIDRAIWAVEFVLVDGKMRALFSMLFGASLLLVGDRAEAGGRSPAAAHRWRMAWLLAIGLVHAFAIWAGDILVLYAVIGAIAWAFRRRDSGELAAAGIVLIAFNATLALFAAVQGARIVSDPVGNAVEAAAYLGGYRDVLGWRLETTGPLLLRQVVTAGPETLGLMLLGMAGLRSGFVTGDWSGATYRRWAWASAAVSLPILTVLAGWCLASGFDGQVLFVAGEGLAAPFRPVMAACYAALVIRWVRRETRGVRAVAAAGRMALSNYLGTSLVCSTLFYGYGWGLYGRLDRAGQLAVALCVMAAMPLWSMAWLRRFRHGPAEWLWRSLARGRVQPLRR